MATTHTLILPSPAKLNLFLHVLNRREDGYHNLQTLFQFMSLGDVITLSLKASDGLNYQGPTIEDNLILRAAELMLKHRRQPLGATIQLKKTLPMGGGLGGGSSNAATTLLGLNTLWNCGLDLSTLMTLGASLGADVPIFIHGHSAYAEGTGEQLTSVMLPECWFLIIRPDCAVNTTELFSHSRLTRRTTSIRIADCDYRQHGNDCEALASELHPEIAEALAWLSQYGFARMTGTGSSIFAAFETKQQAQAVSKKVPPSMQHWVTQGLNKSPLHTTLQLDHTIGVSPSGKAQGFDLCIPRFESWHPSHSPSMKET